MITSVKEKGDGKEFVSHAPGYWSRNGGAALEHWNDWKWQLKNRITTLAQLEEHLELNEEERSGVLLSGDKLALAITPHFFNLIPRDNPDDPIRRQVIPRIEETWTSPYDMADPCGEDSHMPVPGLVHRYPDRVLSLVTDRCASYCRYCTRSRVVSGVGEQELHTNFEEAFRYLEAHTEVRDVLLRGGDARIFSDDRLDKLLMCRVRPYYIYQCDLINGSSHLRTSVAKGIEVIEGLRGHTTGYAVPQFVIDAPGGGGKVPINPGYILYHDNEKIVIRNYE